MAHGVQMKFSRLKKAYLAKIFLTVCALLFNFQNCSNANFTGSKPRTQNSGNGEGYSGKPDQFRYYDPSGPCSEIDRTGKPLPNEEILFQAKASAEGRYPHLVRERCLDIAPVEINYSDLEFQPASNTTFKYQGKSFSALNPPADFDLVANPCPAGTSPIPGALRANMIVSAQDWRLKLSAQGWLDHLGISVSLNGSINSLPSYLVSRDDPASLEEYRRVSQYVTLASTTRHVFSFLARSGSRSGVTFRLYRSDIAPALDDTITVDFDLQTGTSSVRVSTVPVATQVSVVPVANGYLCTVFFTTSANSDQGVSDIGISPTYSGGIGRVGDSIYATLAQLEKVDDICR